MHLVGGNIPDLLRRNHLSITASRKKILEIFLQTENALAHIDIEKKAGEKFDRVTVYRTLQTFLDKGIIHTIPTPDNSIKYALCKDECSEGHHQDQHVHFICESCGITTCLEQVTIPQVNLPLGYKISQVNMVVNGICKDCRETVR